MIGFAAPSKIGCQALPDILPVLSMLRFGATECGRGSSDCVAPPEPLRTCGAE